MVSCWSSECPSVCRTPVPSSVFFFFFFFFFSFPDDNFSKNQWIFSILGVCRSRLGLLMGKFCPFSTEICHDNGGVLISFHVSLEFGL